MADRSAAVYVGIVTYAVTYPKRKRSEATRAMAHPSGSCRQHHPGRGVLQALAGLVFAAVLLAGFSAQARDIKGLEKLKEGGYVILMRHAQTTPGVGDPDGMRLDDCSTQRNLDERGRAQARELGEAFKAAGVTFQKVLSSPWCRCIETAELVAPGAEVEISDALASTWDETSRVVARERAAAAREIISAWRGAGNLLLVTHGVNANATMSASLRQGGFVAIKPDTMEIVLRD
jgi:broad specificity phosphatase PhoE